MSHPLRFLAAPLALLLVHCASVGSVLGTKKNHDGGEKAAEDVSTPSGAAQTDGGAARPKPDPILTFSFDASTATLRASVQADKAKGASLFATIFPIANGTTRALDCAALRRPENAVDLRGAVASGKMVTATVPTDASIFDQARLDGKKRTGIQGCLFDASGGTVAQVSTSLMNAWDADPQVAAATPRVYHGIEAYSNGCIDELGELPMFANGGTFDCTHDPGMHVVPITATDGRGNVVTLDENTTGELGGAELAATQQCDRPAWLGYEGVSNDPDIVIPPDATQCAPFTRVGRYVNSKGTRIVAICRRETVRTLMDPNFDIVAFIAHNPDSGKTCYFNSHMDGSSMDGAHVPPPDTSTADSVWMDMGSVKGQRCPACHDSDPWVHSPWIDQAVAADGHMVLPRLGEDAAYDLTTKYSIFAPDSFLAEDDAGQQWTQPQHLTNIGACGSCHRIGANMTLALFTARSVGEQEPWQGWLTPAFRTFQKLHWMPTTPVSQGSWASSPSGQSMQQIDDCFQDPSSCSVEDVPH